MKSNEIIIEKSTEHKDKAKLSKEIIDIEGVIYFIPVYKHKNYHTHIKEVLLKFADKDP